MPEDLQRVAEEAARFGHIEFQGRLTATATQEQSFKISGGIQNRADVGIQGRIVSIPADGPIKLDFESQLRFQQFVDKPGPSFMLSTTVIAKRGEFVVIGSAPAGFDPGDALILVLHVRK
ncbi:MAG: hypothetical protein IPK83_21550 [Planctomycetes bacterium]|nr:hypothetical protein [Planctomycetota bacterium]